MNLFKKKKNRTKEQEMFLKEFKQNIVRRSFGLFIFIMICSGFKAGFLMTVITSFLIAGFLLLFDKVFDLIVTGIKAIYERFLKEWFDGLKRAKAKIQE